MSLVINAALTMTWYFEDEATVRADEILCRLSDLGAWVPSTWRLEVANAFTFALKRGCIDAVCRDASLNELSLLPITIDVETNTYARSTTLRIAERFSLTTYKAAYLELAQRRSLPLATTHSAMRAADAALDIELLGAG